MQILIHTLQLAAVPLLWFCATLLVVLIGSGQGFYMAFSAYLEDFSSFPRSVLSLLRMSVGDFDYESLQVRAAPRVLVSSCPR